MEIPVRKVRLDDEVWEQIQALPGKTPNDKLRGLLAGKADSGVSGDLRLDEILEHVRSIAAVMPDQTLPNSAQMEMIVDVTMQRKIDERAAARTGQGAFMSTPPPRFPRRETGVERTERESREAVQRVTALDSVDDPSIDRSPEFVSQG